MLKDERKNHQNNIDFNAVKGKTKIPDQNWKDLLDHFNQPGFVLVNDNFEFPDLLGAAYEYLIKYFADSENGKGCYPRKLANGIGFASTEFPVIRAKDNTDAGFIYQWSISKPLRLKASAIMTGSAGQQRVPASFLESVKVSAIAKPQQSKIAEILSTVDQAIEQTEA